MAFFDDCQEMVKLLLDEEITKTLTSANSINVVVGCHKYIFLCL
jgi:threonine synthase